MKKKFKTRTYFKMKYQVYSEYFIGLAIAWFSGGLITLFFRNQVTFGYLLLSIIGLVLSFLFLQLAVEYKVKVKIK